MSKALRFFVVLSLLLPLGLISYQASAQQNRTTVTTVVTDNVGALPGVGVVVKGTTNGGMTDENGSVTLTNVPNNATLVVSYLGYTTVEVPVNGRSQIAVTLEEDTLALEETVVVGYGTQKKVNLTGSVSAVNFETIATKSRPMVNATQALTDATPGLQIMQGRGMPGDEAISMNVRGIGTLNSSGPLVLVDGIEQGINSVNPADIANVSILKDAASCAIYGNRGANGVILVTTKNGSKDGKITVNYDANFAYSEPFKVIHTISSYVDYMNLFNEARENVGGSHIYSDSNIQKWTQASKDPNGKLDPNQAYPNYVAYPNIDWWDYIYLNKWQQTHTVSISGKEKRSGYTMSFGYVDNPGIVRNAGFKRFNGRVNLYSDVTNWLRVGTRISGNRTNHDVSSMSSGFFGSLSTQKMVPATYPEYDGKYGAPECDQEDPQSHNPLWDADGNVGHDFRTNLVTDWYAQVKFLKHFTYNFDYYYTDNRREKKTAPKPLGKYSFQKDTYTTGADDPATLYTYMYYSRSNQYKIVNTLNYAQSFGNHDVSAMLGYEEQEYQYRETNVSKLGLTDAAVNDLNNAANPYSTTGYGNGYTARSWFGRLNYALLGRYLFEANFRYDGSSRFAPAYRWGFFPSFSAGWKISDEPWFNMPNVNNLKLRASWGKLGNNSVGYYAWQSVYNGANYAVGSVSANGIAVTSITNDKIQWEETAVTNLGLDFGMFNGRLNGSIDAYNKLTTGILYAPDISYIYGFASAPTMNLAEVTNRGIEFELEWKNSIGSDFNYSIKGNVAYNKNWVSKYKGKLEEDKSNLGLVSTGGNTRILEDHMINEWYLPSVYKGTGTYFNGGTVDPNGGPKDGMIRTEKDLEWVQAMKAAGYTFQPQNTVAKNQLWYGEYIYADANGDGIYGNANDAEFQGVSTTPKWNYGLSATANWKGFDFSMLWGGSAGFKVYYLATCQNSSSLVSGYAIPDRVAYDHYFYNPDNPSDPRTNLTSNNPRLMENNSQSTKASTRWLFDDSFFKLRNVTLGYTLPQNLTRKFYVERLRIFASGENLWAFTNFPGQDPEMRAGNAAYSTLRQYSFGVNVTF